MTNYQCQNDYNLLPRMAALILCQKLLLLEKTIVSNKKIKI